MQTPATPLLLLLLLLQQRQVQLLQMNTGSGKLDFSIWVDDDRIKENTQVVKFIKHLQSSLYDASNLFYSSTERLGKSKLQFGKIRVAIPRKWQNIVRQERWPSGITISVSDYSLKPDFLIGKCHNSVVQTKLGCGKSGVVALLQANGFLDDSIVALSHEFIQQLVQLRYGIFSEKSQFPQFVDAAGRMRSSSCFERDATSSAASAAASSNSASIMWSSTATSFCSSNRSNKQLLHNDAAPNLQNKICDGVSTGDVMMRHSDFNSSSSSFSSPVIELQLHPQAAAQMTVIIVIDVSGSMSSNNASGIAQDAASRFVMQYLESSVSCGVLAFNDNVNVIVTPTLLSSISRRKSVRSQIQNQLRSGGGTNSRLALDTAVQMLGYNISSIPSKATGTIVFISGSKTNFGNRIDLLSQTQIRVHTIRVGVNASSGTSRLSDRTGGTAYFTNGDLVGFEAAFSGIARDIVNFGKLISLKNERFMSSVRTLSVTVDDSVSRSLSFSLQFVNKQYFIIVTAPSSEQYNSDSGNYIYETTNIGNVHSVTIRIPDDQLETGLWTITNQNPDQGSATGTISVTGKAALDATSYPMLLEAGISHEEIHQATEFSRIIVTASLRRFCSAVIGADVKAVLKQPNGTTVKLKMLDIGVGPDANKDDGIYSTYLPVSAITKRGFYSVEVRTTQPVSRFTSAGRIFVRTDASSKTAAPPARVEDLRVVEQTGSELTLRWTAVGTELFHGRLAGTYKVHMSTNTTEVIVGKKITNSRSCYEEPQTVTPTAEKNIGDTITTTVRMPKCAQASSRIYVAVIVHFISNVKLNLSNIAWYDPEMIFEEDKLQPQGMSGGAVVGIVLAVVAIISCMALAAIVLLKSGLLAAASPGAGQVAVPIEEDVGDCYDDLAMVN